MITLTISSNLAHSGGEVCLQRPILRQPKGKKTADTLTSIA